MRYVEIAASQTNAILGTSGNASPGDILIRLVIVVATAATGTVTISDGGGSAISIMPASPGGGVGVYPVTLDMVSKRGQWTITTGAGCTVVAVGIFK